MTIVLQESRFKKLRQTSCPLFFQAGCSVGVLAKKAQRCAVLIRPSVGTKPRGFLQPKKTRAPTGALVSFTIAGDYFLTAAFAFFAGALAATFATGLAAGFAFA